MMIYEIIKPIKTESYNVLSYVFIKMISVDWIIDSIDLESHKTFHIFSKYLLGLCCHINNSR